MAYRFGPFQLDPRTGALSGPEGPIPLRRQAFRLAEVLLARAPELLERDVLLDLVWGRTALSPNALPQTISELRHALGDDAHHPRFIETVHRRGYRFVCGVERIAPEPPGALPAREAPDVPVQQAPMGVTRALAILLVVALLVASTPAPPTVADTALPTCLPAR